MRSETKLTLAVFVAAVLLVLVTAWFTRPKPKPRVGRNIKLEIYCVGEEAGLTGTDLSRLGTAKDGKADVYLGALDTIEPNDVVTIYYPKEWVENCPAWGLRDKK